MKKKYLFLLVVLAAFAACQKESAKTVAEVREQMKNDPDRLRYGKLVDTMCSIVVQKQGLQAEKKIIYNKCGLDVYTSSPEALRNCIKQNGLNEEALVFVEDARVRLERSRLKEQLKQRYPDLAALSRSEQTSVLLDNMLDLETAKAIIDNAKNRKK